MFKRKGEHSGRGFQLDLRVKAWKDDPIFSFKGILFPHIIQKKSIPDGMQIYPNMKSKTKFKGKNKHFH